MGTDNSPWYSLLYYGLEFIGRYYSSYRGFVVDNNDPGKLNMIRVLIPVLNNLDKKGVWAYPKGNWGGKDYGVNFLPQNGDMVWVEFEHGDQNYPIWCFASYGENEIPAEFDSPSKYGFKTPGGSIILINDIKGEEEILVKHSNSSEYIQLIKDKATLEAKQVVLEGTLINLGVNGDEQALLGDTTKAKIDNLLDEVSNLLDNVSSMNTALVAHTHPAPLTPSTTYVATGASATTSLSTIKQSLSKLKTTLVDILSNKVKIDK